VELFNETDQMKVVSLKQLVYFCSFLSSFFIVGCQQQDQQIEKSNSDPSTAYSSKYQLNEDEPPFVIEHATILTGTGKRFDDTSILVEKGRIKLIGKNFYVPPAVTRYDADGQWVTPGLIDVHSHLGVYSSPHIESSEDGNEMSSPNTAEVWAEHSVWTQDPGMPLALAGGVTTFQVLPGSANLFGGRGVTLKNVYARSVYDMKFPNAPQSLKMACGENPKRVYGANGTAPSTRMGNVAGYRNAWVKASDYRQEWDEYYLAVEAGDEIQKPERDIQLDTLAEVLRGNILVHNHCYRAEEMLVMIEVAKEFGYQISAFHHAVEAYKVADILAEQNICSAVWADWWGFKHEAFDHVRENAAMLEKASACAIIHSDSEIGIQHLNQEAAKAMAAGNKSGLDLKPKEVISWITSNAAKAIGIDDQTGTIEENKMADIVIWSENPFSVYAKTNKVFIDGRLVYDREDQKKQPTSDFELGILDPAEGRLR
jgi:imidazolonepropionase-like amidohydrolase